MNKLHVTFICTGNICRSPMADLMLQHKLQQEKINNVLVTSAGLGGWHEGDLADERTQTVLKEYGYPTKHTAKKISVNDLDADLILAMDSGHKRELLKLGVNPNKVKLIRDFDPDSPLNSSVEDPYYGNLDNFRKVRSQLEKSMPGLINWIKDELKKI